MTGSALRKWVTLVGSAAIASLLTLPAHADGTAPGATANETEIVAYERPSTRSFYGWQILATGEAGGILAAASLALPESPMKSAPSAVGALAGMPFYALGGPATHWTHGAFEKGIISLGANVVTPIVTGFIGQAVGSCGQDSPQNCDTQHFLDGFAIALITIPIADAFILGWEDVPVDDFSPPTVSPGTKASASRAVARTGPMERRPTAPPFAVIPAWSLGPRGEVAFSLTGRF